MGKLRSARDLRLVLGEWSLLLICNTLCCCCYGGIVVIFVPVAGCVEGMFEVLHKVPHDFHSR